MADGMGIYRITADLQECTLNAGLSASLDVSGSLNIKRMVQREAYKNILLSNDPPSWTQYYANKRHAYVIGDLSSSFHEVFMLNAYIVESTS